MVNCRKFIISGSLFSRYETIINFDLVESVEDIISEMVNEIKQQVKNFPQLLDALERETYHIHDYDIGDILISKNDEVFYICSHC